MPDANDIALLREYADSNSETAFAGLVHRHINLVYSVALRFTGNSPDAQDVTQAVFIILAQKAASLRQRTTLTGWLYETTRFTARQLLRTRARQQAREQEAYMQSTLNDSNSENVWRQLAPLLEEAMARLSEKERTLVALRFFENKNAAETAALLGIQEWAAHKRAARAMEKLRQFFVKRGIASTTATLAGAISANSIQAAPAALIKTTTAVALAKGAAASTSTLTLIKGALKIMAWTKAQTAIVAGVAIILATGTATLVVKHYQPQTDFPRSSWANAGYADPTSALETYFWASRQGDGKSVLTSMSPDLQDFEQQTYGEMLQKLNMPLEQFVSQFYASDVGSMAGFRIVKSEVVRVPKGWSPGTIKLTDYENLHPDAGWDDQVQLQVHLYRSVTANPDEEVFVMKKIGNEWKVDDEPAHWDAPIARQLLQQHPELVPK